MRAQVSEVVLLTQFARKLTLCLYCFPPSVASILTIKIGIFILVPTLTIIFTLFLIPSRLLVALLVRRLHRKYTRSLGDLRRSCGLFRSGLINRKLAHLFHNRIRRFGTCTTHDAIDIWSRFDLGIETRMQSVRYNLIQKSGLNIDQIQLLCSKNILFLVFNSICRNILRYVR